MPGPVADPTRQMIYGLLLNVLMLKRPEGMIGQYGFKWERKMSLPDDINIDCQYQRQGVGSLICRAADTSWFKSSTNEPDDRICHDCEIGKVYRELGCENISGKIVIGEIRSIGSHGQKHVVETILYCNLRRRPTNYSFCLSCPYIGTKFTKPVLKKTIDFFEKLGFDSARNDLEKAQERLNNGDEENAITNAISALESVFKTILDFYKRPYPQKEQVTTLWKTVKDTLHLGDEVAAEHIKQLVGNVSGAVTSLGGLRNDLSDAHGKGLISSEVYDSYAELAVNLSATICLFVIRRYQEIESKRGKRNV
jgi:hypothetical protein